MNAHTPGPWTATGIHVFGANDEHVAKALIENDQPLDVARANARLIAAAPDLLAVLKALMADTTAGVGVMVLLTPALATACHVVIAKAEGR